MRPRRRAQNQGSEHNGRVTEDPAELARRISDADRRSKPADQRLRFQWNVPQGTTPHVPLWLSLTFLALIVIAVLSALL